MNKLTAAAKTDAAAETEGNWFGYTVGTDVYRMRIARAGASNTRYMKMQEEMLRPYRIGTRNGEVKIDPETDRNITRKIAAKTLVTDWNADDIGEPFSVEACEAMLKDAPDIQAWIMTVASNGENYRTDAIKANSGN